jgi:PD-(D/E)XK nuclease superfamily
MSRFSPCLRASVVNKGISLNCGFNFDLIVENIVILELKCLERSHIEAGIVRKVL